MTKSKGRGIFGGKDLRAEGRVGHQLVGGALVMGLLVTIAGCRDQANSDQTVSETVAQIVAKPRIEVGVSGCSGLVQDAERGLLCLTRKPKPLHLWLDGASDFAVELRFEGAMIEGKRTASSDGVLVSVEAPLQQGQLELKTDDGEWAIELVPVTNEFENVRKGVQSSWEAGDTEALKRFNRRMTEATGGEATLLECLGARLALAAGDIDGAVAIANRVIDSTTVSCAGRAALLAAYVTLYLRPDFISAEHYLRAAETVQAVDFDTRIGVAYLRGVLEHRIGQIDESLLSFERAARLAELVRDDDQLASALVMQAVALARLGRFEEAEALARQVEIQASKLEHEKLALDLRSSVAWITVLRREDDPSVADPVSELREIIAAYSARDDQRNLANRRLDLALALVQNQELEAATLQLAELQPAALDPDLLVWFELTAARIEVLRKRFEVAEAHLDRASLLAALNQDRELQWRVLTSQGELEQARGRTDEALMRFVEASRLADSLSLSIAGNAGRSHFVTTHSRADVALISLLLERGETEAAMCATMAARARHLRGLWVRLRPPLAPEVEDRYRKLLSRYQERKQAIAIRLEKSWELSTSELEELRGQLDQEGEHADQLLAEATALLEDGAPSWSCTRTLPQRLGDAVLTMAPGPDGRRWSMMLATRNAEGLSFASTDIILADSGQVDLAADKVLEHFADLLEGRRNLRVIPVGVFVAADFHLLWFLRGKIRPTITYSLGLGTSTKSVRNEPRAAVITSSRDLAAAAQETAAVGERLGELGWIVQSRWIPGEDVEPQLLHYAGHGLAGELGWQSAIELPEFGRVSAAQIVASQRSPDLVVLSACSAGRVTGESIDGGMNLASAFVLAGAQLVIAPVRDVDDETALELGSALYRELDVVTPEALARALGVLQLGQLVAEQQRIGAESFMTWRAWTP